MIEDVTARAVGKRLDGSEEWCRVLQGKSITVFVHYFGHDAGSRTSSRWCIPAQGTFLKVPDQTWESGNGSEIRFRRQSFMALRTKMPV